jgi:hypothetical protein
MSRLLILLTAAFLIASAAIGSLWATYQFRMTLLDIFFYMTPVLKLLALLIVIMTGVGAANALKQDPARVRTSTIVTVAFGALGAGYGELNTHFGVLYDSEVNFEAMAPGRIESLAILALGLLGAILPLAILHVRSGIRRG